MTKRMTHRSTSGTKLYAVHNVKGCFKDIQTLGILKNLSEGVQSLMKR